MGAREKEFLTDKQFVLIDELLIDGDYKQKISTLNVVRPLMSEEQHDARPLFKTWRQIYSTCNFFLFTNHKEAIAVEKNEERFTIIEAEKNRDEMGGDAFFKPYWEELKHGKIAHVVKHYLQTRPISNNFRIAGPCIKTEALEKMSEAGGHPMFPEVKTLLREGAEPFNRSVISISEAYSYLKKEKRVKGSLNELADTLRKLGCKRLGECKHKLSRKGPILYITKNFEFFECEGGMSNAEIANNYWLPIECGAMSTSSETYNLSAGDINLIREQLKAIDAYEDLMNKEEEAPNIIKIDEVTDIPRKIKKRSKK